MAAKTPSKTPDYNPDKERHVDHVFAIQNADPTKKDIAWVDDGKTAIKLDRYGRAFTKDEGLARAIQERNRHGFTVSRMANSKPADRGHTYFFGSMPEMPWKRRHDETQEQETKDAETKDQQEDQKDQNGVAHAKEG